MYLVEKILYNSGVLNETSNVASYKGKVRTAVLRAIDSKRDLQESLKLLSERFGVLITTEYQKNPKKGYFYVDLEVLKIGDKESFVEYIG